MIDVTGIPKHLLLKHLYNGAQPQGVGRFLAREDLSTEEAKEITDRDGDCYYDYLYGRPLKSDFSGNTYEERLYDRDAGRGAAQRAIDAARAEMTVEGMVKA